MKKPPTWVAAAVVVAIAAAMIVPFGLLVFVVPVFERMFQDFGGTLPGPTQAVISLSNLIREGSPYFAMAGLGGIVFVGLKARELATRATAVLAVALLFVCVFIAATLTALYLPIFQLAGNIK